MRRFPQNLLLAAWISVGVKISDFRFCPSVVFAFRFSVFEKTENFSKIFKFKKLELTRLFIIPCA